MADRIRASSEWLDKCARDLRDIENAINSAGRTLGSVELRRDEGGNLRASLSCSLRMNGARFSANNAADDIRQLERAASALTGATASFSGGIVQAARIFENAENKAVQLMRGKSSGKEADVYEEGGNGGVAVANIDWTKGGWKIIDDILDWLNIGRYRRDYKDPGEKAQREHDALMQEQISDVMHDPRYSMEAWDNASMEERQEILNGVKNELCRIYGVNISSDVEYFYDPGHKEDDGKVYITHGYYQDSSRSVHINTYDMMESTYEENMTTLVHEMRHAYQHEVVRHPERFQVSEKTARSWEDNFAPGHYKTTNKDGYDAYRAQPVEWDARNFSENLDYV